MYDNAIKLAQQAFVKDERKAMIPQPVNWAIAKELYCDVLSISRSEFYQATQAHYKPEIMFKIADKDDYDGEDLILFEGTVYKVVRTYGTSWLEIVVELARPEDNYD